MSDQPEPCTPHPCTFGPCAPETPPPETLEFILRGPPDEVHAVLARLSGASDGGDALAALSAQAAELGMAMAPQRAKRFRLNADGEMIEEKHANLAWTMSFSLTPDEDNPVDGDEAYTFEARAVDAVSGDVRFSLSLEGQTPLNPLVLPEEDADEDEEEDADEDEDED